MATTQPSFCRFCHSACGILVDVDEGRPVRVRGDRENPAYRGFCCIKGQQLPDQWAHPDRLLQTHKRMPDGSHQPVPLAEAVEDIAERLSEILVTSGPRSVALYTGTYSIANPATMPVALAFMDALGSSMHFTSNSIDQPGKAVSQALHGSWLAPSPPFEKRDVVLLIGTNPVATMAGGLPLANPGRELTDTLARGTRFIVIDPRRTDVAQRAHLHLQSRPGEDIAIVAAMLNVILREELFDAEFVRENVSGLAALRASVAPFDPDRVARRADIEVADLIEAARLFAGARGRGLATAGTGPNFNGRGTLFEYLVLALNTVCGQWSRAGDPVTQPGTLNPRFPAIAQAAPPRPGYGYGQRLRVRDLANCDGGLQAAALAEEILLEGEGQVRALLSVGGNPASAIPDQALNVRAFEQLDLLVHVDIKLSTTASLADYVIAPKLPLEMPGMTATQEMITFYAAGMGYSDAYAMYTPPIVEPPEDSEVVDEWAFFYALAQRMKLPLEIPPSPLASAESGGAVLLDMERTPTNDELFEILTRDARIPLAEVKRHRHGAFFRDESLRVAEREVGWEGRLEVGNPEMLSDLGDVAGEMDEQAELNGYPYRLVCRRMIHTFNSSGQELEKLRSKWAYNPAFMHPQDLEEEGLGTGDLVEIASRSGRMLGIVESDETLRRGLVSMVHVFGHLPGMQDKQVREWGTNANRLLQVDQGVDRYTGQPRMSNVPVRVSAAEPSA
jgi:anaerobic selenocysteine-containing dehydrogenase